jgi:hypothetical protein
MKIKNGTPNGNPFILGQYDTSLMTLAFLVAPMVSEKKSSFVKHLIFLQQKSPNKRGFSCFKCQ